MKKVILIICAFVITSSVLAQNIRNEIYNGNLETVKDMVEESPELIENPEFGLSLLIYAVRFDKPEIVKYLISKGADIEYGSNTSGLTAMRDAVRLNNLDMLKLLAEKGGDVKHKSRQGESYLHVTALFNNIEIADYFLKQGVDINNVKSGNLTALHIASVVGNKEMVEFLISKGADLNVKSTDGGTALHFAMAARQLEIADILKKNGAIEMEREFPIYKGPYLGQKAPKSVSEPFVPELFRDIYRVHSAPSFSADGTELYWECIFMNGLNSASRIWYMEMKEGIWQAPKVAPFSNYASGGPSLSHDGSKIVFHSYSPTEQEPEKKDLDLWYAERLNRQWSEAKHLGYQINSKKEYETYPYYGNENTIYFKSGRKLMRSKAIDGVFQKPEYLGDLFNSDYVDDCQENKSIIFFNDRRKGLFFYELYVSFHNEDGTWSPAKYLGEEFHQGRRATGSKISFDGKYLFYCSNFSFYWVDTQIIHDLKNQ